MITLAHPNDFLARFSMPHYYYVSLFFALLLIFGLPRHAESMGPGDDPLRLNLDHRPADQAETVYGFRMQAAAGSAGETPFWLHSNRYGELERFSNNASLHLFGRTAPEYLQSKTSAAPC